jgi:hypothetical protein
MQFTSSETSRGRRGHATSEGRIPLVKCQLGGIRFHVPVSGPSQRHRHASHLANLVARYPGPQEVARKTGLVLLTEVQTKLELMARQRQYTLIICLGDLLSYYF